MSFSFLTSTPVGLRRSRDVQRPDLQDGDARDHERQQVVEREEAGQRGLVGGIAAEDEYAQRLADHRNGREEAGDDLRAPVAHLAPRQDVAHEGGRHHQQVDDEAEQPHHLARRLVGTVIKAAEDVDVDDREEEARAVLVNVAQHPARRHVAHDSLDAVEGGAGEAVIMHRQHDAGDDLDHQREPREDPEIPEIIEVARHRITAADGAVDEARHRQTLVHPLHERRGGFVGLGPGKAHGVSPQPIRTTVSLANS